MIAKFMKRKLQKGSRVSSPEVMVALNEVVRALENIEVRGFGSTKSRYVNGRLIIEIDYPPQI